MRAQGAEKGADTSAAPTRVAGGDAGHAAAACCPTPAPSAQRPAPCTYTPIRGFSGPIRTEWDSDGRTMTVLEYVTYTDSRGQVWELLEGTKINGASIPVLVTVLISFLVSLVKLLTCDWRGNWSYAPYSDLYRDASALHDRYCVLGEASETQPPRCLNETRCRPRRWQDTHWMLYDAAIWSGLRRRRALVIWASVYLFGPRWGRGERKRRWLRWAGSAVVALAAIVPALVSGCAPRAREQVLVKFELHVDASRGRTGTDTERRRDE